jgi:hypothetical protein
MNSTCRRITSLLCIVLLSAALFGQSASAEEPRKPWSVQLELGGGVPGGEASGELGVALLWEYRSWLDIGLSARTMSMLDHGSEDTLGREYHMETSYGALRIRPKMEITPGWELAFPLEMGNGILIYRYESSYAEELRWTEEILDQVNYAVYSAGVENIFALGERYSLFIRGGVRTTSPIRTDLAERDELSGFWADTGVSYRF